MKKEIKFGNSKAVTTTQEGIHKDLLKIVLKHKETSYRRPISTFTLLEYEKLLPHIEGKKLIIDAGCGVGLSSVILASENEDAIIIGIDRSIDRLERKNAFKRSLPSNLFFVRGKLDEWWPLLLRGQNEKKYKVIKNYLLYPNPYPKQKSLKLRFHAHPVFRSLMEFGTPIILRSNFLLYLQEFEFAALQYERSGCIRRIIEIENPLTYFEKKYDESGHALYELFIN